MKITIESNHGTFSAEYKDVTIIEMAMQLKGMMVACGFHPESVDSVFDPCVIDPWFSEKDDEDEDDTDKG
jgi:hypothetical protein